jgi:phosphatidyl-myo-inositol alpha-mannosyltransferase
LKIAQICPYDIHRPGGVQRHILDLSTALRELQHDVTIIAPRVPSRSTSACFDQSAIPPVIVNVGCSRVIRFNKTQLEISIALGTHHARLKRTVRDGEFDVLHFHTMLSPFLSAQIYKLSTSANVATFHDVPPATRFGFIQRRILRTVGNRLMRHLDGVIFASNVQSDIYRIDNLPLRVTIPPCTDLGRFPAAAVSNRINVDDCVNILFLGRLEPRKGVMVLLEAFRRLCSDGLQVTDLSDRRLKHLRTSICEIM